MAEQAILLKFKSNKRLEETRFQSSFQDEQNQPVLTELAAHIKRTWESAKIAKQPIDDQHLKNLRQREGEYEPDVLAQIRQMGGSEIYMLLTDAKCRGAEAWIREVELPAQEKAWGVDPSPVADLPPEVRDAVLQQSYDDAMMAGWDLDAPELMAHMQFLRDRSLQLVQELAQETAERMERRIDDQFHEGNFYDAVDDVIYDFVTFKACFLKGPVRRRKKVLEWAPMSNGQWVPVVKEKIVEEYERRPPWDIFPAAGSKGIDHADLIDRYRLTRAQIGALKGVEGYSDEAIDAVLEQYGDKGRTEWLSHDQRRAQLEAREHERYDPMQPIDALNYWGSVPGKWLNEWSRSDKYNATEEYAIEAWLIGNYVIKASINEHPLGKKPYSKASFDPMPGAFWGKGLPEKLADVAAMCNAAARALSNNMAIASGPQVEVNVDRLADGEKVTAQFPWKVWQTTTDLTGNNQPAVRYFQPGSNAQELMIIYQQFERIADTVSGIPAYAYGDAKVQGAGRTASGLGMLMGNASKGLRKILFHFDRHLVAPTVDRTYVYNMLFDPDVSIKGDLVPVARGAAALIVREQMQMRRTEILQTTLNPIDAQILGVDGRAELLRENIKAADLPVQRILPDKFELELRAAAMPPPWQLLGGKSAGSTPGSVISPPGGSPAQPQNVDQGGNPAGGPQPAAGEGAAPAPTPQGPGMVHGGVVGKARYRMVRNPEDGSVEVEVMT